MKGSSSRSPTISAIRCRISENPVKMRVDDEVLADAQAFRKIDIGEEKFIRDSTR